MKTLRRFSSRLIWRQRYGSDPSIIGGIVDLDGKPFTVIGIAPPGFFGEQLRNNAPGFFLPLNTEPSVEADADLNKPSSTGSTRSDVSGPAPILRP